MQEEVRSLRDAALTPQQTYRPIADNVERVIRGQRATLRHLLAALAAGGHVLLEDYPGTGKTTLSKAIARSIGARYKRVQFTPDLLPSDILGVSVFDPRNQQFDFREGPIFTNILLADEINRASPRTQSALLEAMAEQQVTVEGRTLALPRLFFVLATQNPVEFRGTYPLPEAQMDRFAARLGLGYLDTDDEIAIVTDQRAGHPLEQLEACVRVEDVLALQEAVPRVEVSEEVLRYGIELVRATRSLPAVQLGAGPRASITLVRSAQALALFDGVSFVTPDHVREMAVDVLAHRLVLDAQSRFSGASAVQIVAELLDALPVPG